MDLSIGGKMGMKIVPFFQPIVSLEDGLIYGYEVLARKIGLKEAISLGDFFADESISPEEKLQTDRAVRRQAFEYYKSIEEELNFPYPQLFVNIHPSWLEVYQKKGETIFPSIQMMTALGIRGNRVVIEITEHQFNSDVENINQLLQQYRDFGCKIAVDDFHFENFDRLIAFKPDIVKIDIELVKRSLKDPDYNKLIQHVSRFCSEIGVSVLFEGVETKESALNAVQSGANLLQGFYFSKAEKAFQKQTVFSKEVSHILSKSVFDQYRHAQACSLAQKQLNRILDESLREIPFLPHQCREPDRVLSSLVEHFPRECYRAYICESDGKQISSNFTRSGKTGEYLKQEEYCGKNWAWRPYFVFNTVRLHSSGLGILSEPYLDREHQVALRTFSYPLNENTFLFVDILEER